MKKVNVVKWKRFKESMEGQEAIALFRHAVAPDCSLDELLTLAKKYNAEYFRNMGQSEEQIKNEMAYARDLIKDYIDTNSPSLDTAEELEDLYVQVCFSFLLDNFYDDIKKELGGMPENLKWSDIPEKYFKVLLSFNLPLSFAFYSLRLDNFIPNLFIMQFAQMKRFAENNEIELPLVPNRSRYSDRCLYYLDLCSCLIDFFVDSDITDMAEISAYIFAYEFPEIKGELESEQRPMPNNPEQVWLLVGNLRGDEKNMTRGFWQGNALAHRGDLCLFYEKSPVKAMNAAWIVKEDGVIDPFFYYYSNIYIGDRIEFPAISFNEFINNEYFITSRVDENGKELPGNYVKKHFQDCSGWSITATDYNEIQRMLSAKGFDVSLLPQLPKYEPIKGVNIHHEIDVTKQLMAPLLNRMGYELNKDYFYEVEFRAGHSETGHGLDKRPDICLHMTGSGLNKGAQVIIEMKLDMSSEKKRSEAFDQGLSYAKYGEARIFCLADQAGIYVFKRDKNRKFIKKFDNYYKWEDMVDNDKYNKLKRLFEKS